MKLIVFSVLLSVAGAVAAQTPAPAAPKPEPIKEQPIQAAPAKSAQAAKPTAAKPAKHTNRRQEDARPCLDKATNTDIIKCAEEYL
jgi:hypothetical protein